MMCAFSVKQYLFEDKASNKSCTSPARVRNFGKLTFSPEALTCSRLESLEGFKKAYEKVGDGVIAWEEHADMIM